jgi:hypothetical protein
MRFEILCFGDFLEVRTYGDADLKGCKDFIRAFLAHEHWHPGGALLINHSELNSNPLTTDDIIELAQFTKPFLPQMGKARIALLVSRNLEFGMGRMWQSFASEGRESVSEVFKSREQAISWLKKEQP